MASKLIDKINKKNAREKIPEFRVGDTLKVHVRIKEGDKERVQLFQGTVISRSGSRNAERFTVRRVSHGVGVERVFPLHSPHIAKLEVVGSSRVRRAKLYYLRARKGKQGRLEEVVKS